jgi:hypothetical protein
LIARQKSSLFIAPISPSGYILMIENKNRGFVVLSP